MASSRHVGLLVLVALVACGASVGCSQPEVPGRPDDAAARSRSTLEPDARASTGHDATTTTAPPGAYGPGWSAVHSDSTNSDYSRLLGAAQLEFAWQRHLEGGMRIGELDWTINLGPTSDASGRLYVTSTVPGCHLQALDSATGETLWCAEEVALPAVISSPLIDRDGRLFVADGVAMRAFDRDGEVLWQRPIIGVPLSAQFSPGGNLVFVTHVGVVYLLDRATGEEILEPVDLVPEPAWDTGQPLWACARGTAGCPSANTPVVDLATGRLFFTWWEPGAAQAGIRAMRIAEGPEPAVVDLWSNATLPGGTGASPVLSEDGRRLYVTDNVDSVHALDAATGEEIWSHAIGFAAAGSLSLSPEGLIMAPGGVLQAIRDDGDRATLVWRDETLLNRGIATQASGRKAYATVLRAPGELDLVVVDTGTGDVLDRHRIDGVTRFSVGISLGHDATVFVPTIVGTLVAFRPTG